MLASNRDLIDSITNAATTSQEIINHLTKGKVGLVINIYLLQVFKALK